MDLCKLERLPVAPGMQKPGHTRVRCKICKRTYPQLPISIDVATVRVNCEGEKPSLRNAYGFVKMARNFAGAIIRNSKSGFKKAPSKVIAERLAACMSCDKLQGSQCGICGCFVKAKTALALESCPDVPSKWGEVSE